MLRGAPLTHPVSPQLPDPEALGWAVFPPSLTRGPRSVRSTAVGIGFYGNSETNDGVYQLLYALDNANHTLTGIDSLVGLRGRDPRPPRCPPGAALPSCGFSPPSPGAEGAGKPAVERGRCSRCRRGGCRGPSPAPRQGWAEPPWPSAGG